MTALPEGSAAARTMIALAVMSPDGENVPSYETVQRYWNDPVFRGRIHAERDRRRATANAEIDRGMSAMNAAQAARWEMEARHG